MEEDHSVCNRCSADVFWGGGCDLLGGITEVRADNCGGLLEEDVYQPESSEVIRDPILHWAVRASMNAVKSGVKLTADMVADKSVHTISYELCNHPEDFAGWKMPYYIESLEGLQYATSAKMIDIGYTANIEGKKIESLAPLSGLDKLEILYLKQNGIADISPLAEMSGLRELNLSGNHDIESISAVKNLDKLTILDVSINKVSDLTPIEGLTSLERLNAGHNQIAALPDLSGLENLKALDLSENKLTDVSGLTVLTGLEELNLSGNSGITDVKALAALTNLKEKSTYLPTEQMKEDLFAAIEVNRKFLKFNISKMTAADLDHVSAALQAYEALTEEQKAYIDKKMVEAARSNHEKVQKGENPQYYAEYDRGGEPVPVLDRVVIHVVDKHGAPMKGVTLVRKNDFGVTTSKKTNEQGVAEFLHGSYDKWCNFEVRPEGDIYVADPEKITYSVTEKQETGMLNGKPATGLETLTMMLIPVEEYVDKSDLKAAIKETGDIPQENEYRYTAETWKAYQSAMEHAKSILENPDAEKSAVADAASALRQAYSRLTKAKILTKLKIIVKDENGNPFTRKFKFQIRNPKNHREAWNDYSDPATSVAYLDVSNAWTEGKEWEVLACEEEPYQFTSFQVTIGKQGTQSYFKTVGGVTVGVDYETEVTLVPADKGTATIKPDNTVLAGYIEQAGKYEQAAYTPGTWSAFKQKLSEAQKALKDGTTQEEYNKAAAELLKAEKELRENAEKQSLGDAIDDYYLEDSYTPNSWAVYKEALDQAKRVYGDAEATQEAVDQALADLKDAQEKLKFRAEKKGLSAAIQKASDLRQEDYTEGWEKMQEALASAKRVNQNLNATQEEVDQETEKLEKAIEALKKAPAGPVETCGKAVFRAVVQDEKGNRLPGIRFTLSREGVDETEPLVSDENGVLTCHLSSIDWKHETTVRLAEGQGYTTEDSHSYTVTGFEYFPNFDKIDDQPFQEGTRLTYTLKKESTGGAAVLSDKKTFRAKVVDEAGNPVSGVLFCMESDYEHAGKYNDIQTDENGILEYPLTTNDGEMTITVTLKEGQEASEGRIWKTEDTCAFTTGAVNWITRVEPDILKINDKDLEQAGEIVFHLKKGEGGNTPSVDKADLLSKLEEAEKISGSQYTENSFAALQTAIAEARKVYENAEASKEQIAEQITKLDEAIRGLEKTETPVYCERQNIRIKVIDEQGKSVENGIPFSFVREGNTVYNATTYQSQVGYMFSTADAGTEKITVSLKDGSVIRDGQEYVAEPEQFVFKLKPANPGVEIESIDGEPFTGPRELTFTLKRRQVAVDKSGLKQKIEAAQESLQEKDSYTLNSVQKLETALAEAKEVNEDESADQTRVEQACAALDEAIQGLKRIQGVRTLVLPVKLESGTPAAVNTKFIRRDLKYSVNNPMFVNGEGNLIWKPATYDEGDYEFFLPEDSAYLSSPGRIKVRVGKEDGTPVIEKVAEKPAEESVAEFILFEKQKDRCDLKNFRAVVQDKNGEPLSGIVFTVKNGDPAEITSDKNGVITYEATMWDTDTTMTVKLKDNQDWICQSEAQFSVIADPRDEEQAILGTVNGAAFQGGEEITFVLLKEGEVLLDWSDLETAMNRAESLDSGRYTAESFAKVTEKLKAAQNIYGKTDVDQSEIDQKTRELNDAINSLKTKPTPTKPAPAVKAQSVSVNAASKQIAAGKKVQLSAVVAPANTTNKTVIWSSSNPKYATVDATGKVTAKKAGAGKSVTITATAADGSGKAGSVTIKILKDAVKSVKLKAAKTVKAGKKIKVKITIKTTGKKANKKLKWKSSNTKYATVSSQGVVKTKKAGKGKTVKITAISTDGTNKKKTVKIKIK